MKKQYTITIITLCVLIIILLAVDIVHKKAPTSAQVEKSTTVTTTTSQDLSISDVANVTIPNFATDDGSTVTLKQGSYDASNVLQGEEGNIDTQSEIDLDTDNGAYAVTDLNGDGVKDIVAIFGASGGGSGYFMNLAVFLNKNGKAEYTTSVLLGDRVKINNVSVGSNNIISVDMITQGPNDPLCCGTLHKVVTYSFKNNELKEVK